MFGYRKFESVKDIIRGFGMLPMDMYIDRSRLLLLHGCMRSDRCIVRMCAKIGIECDSVCEKCDVLNVCLSFSCVEDIKRAFWESFVQSVGW